jgi:hypothetical protein
MSNTLRVLGGLALLGTLAACAEPPPPAASVRRVFYVDTVGKSAVCTPAQNVSLTAGRQTDVTMTMSNEGGWCGITLSQAGQKPYDAGMLVQRPQHGRVLVRQVGDVTRVDYFPDRSFAGTDAFTVRFVPGNPALKVTVTVQAAAPAPAAPRR